MGTDIHLYVERQQPDGTWKIVPPPAPPPESERTEARKDRDGTDYNYVSPFWGPHGCMYITKCYGLDDNCTGPGCPACLGTGTDLRWYHNRNYDAFAILTGTVRNGHGFAGVPTSSGFKGITDEPRGLPDDASPTVRNHHSWDHSESWLSLPEILAFDWNQTTTHTGVIPMRSDDEPNPWGKIDPYAEWRQREPRVAPVSYSGGISGLGIQVIPATRADQMLRDAQAGLTIDPRTRWFVQVTWQETYRTSAEDFLAFVNQMLVPLGDPAQTRIVFGFDS